LMRESRGEISVVLPPTQAPPQTVFLRAPEANGNEQVALRLYYQINLSPSKFHLQPFPKRT